MQNWNKNTEQNGDNEAEKAEEDASKKRVCDDLFEFFSRLFDGGFLLIDFCEFFSGGKHKTKVDKNLQKIHNGFDVSEIAINFDGKTSSQNWQN